MNRKKPPLGRFFVVSAPSGTGKTTLLKRLLSEFGTLGRSVSCTTRPPRPGEREGEDYYFIGEPAFRDRVRQDQFFEWEEVHGALYGTPKAPLLLRREEGKDTVFDLDTRGALSLKRSFPDSCLIFLGPPSLEALEKRLRTRRTESEPALRLRLEDARREMEEQDKYDYVIINDDLQQAYQELKEIFRNARKEE